MSDPVHILVVEDNTTLRSQIVQILDLEGYRVSEACNGRDGLAAAFRKAPELVICDVSMPDMDGYEMLKALRASEVGSTIPFIVLSARVARHDVRTGMDLGADDYLTKPFEMSELLRAVESRLRRKAENEARVEQGVVNEQSRMLLMLPHELRTPLNGILGAAEILRFELEATGGLPGETAAMLDLIQTSSVRLEQLATNLVLHLQLELAGKGDGDASVFRDLGPAPLAESLRHAAEIEAKKNQRITDLQLGDLPILNVPLGTEFLTKIFRELIDNAFKFSSPGSRVEISTHCISNRIEVRISDRGIGITAEEAAGMRPFQQWRRSQNEQQGLGLGVSIARTLASMNGSTVSIAPRVGGGVCATVSLPIAVG